MYCLRVVSTPLSRKESKKYSTRVKGASLERKTSMKTMQATSTAITTTTTSDYPLPEQHHEENDEVVDSTGPEEPTPSPEEDAGPLYASTSIPVSAMHHIFPENERKIRLPNTEESIEEPDQYEQMLTIKTVSPLYANIGQEPSKAPNLYVNYPKHSS